MTKKKTKKAKTLFSHIKQITSVQDVDYWDTLSEADKKTWSNFLIHRFLSMNEEWTELISEIQPVSQTLEPKHLYLLLIGLIPKSKKYVKWIKGKKQDKYEPWLVELMIIEFECSKEEANDYLNILYSTKEGREMIQFICQKYGTDKKKIKKVLK